MQCIDIVVVALKVDVLHLRSADVVLKLVLQIDLEVVLLVCLGALCEFGKLHLN